MIMKNRSRRYDIYRPRSKHKRITSSVNMMMFICIKQHLSNIWGSSHDKVKQHWDWVKNEMLLVEKEACTQILTFH